MEGNKKPGGREMKIEILDKAHHRNGVGGVPFEVSIIKDSENGKMLVIRFDDQAEKMAGGSLCAVLKLDLLKDEKISFGVNSWRGDVYASAMDEVA